MKALIYDIEIVQAIPSKRGPRLPGIDYCQGWYDHENMGISVIGTVEWPSLRPHIFLQDNIKEFFVLSQQSDLLVGFNNINFDDRVILATYPEVADYFTEIPRYDLFREIWAAANLGPEFKYPTHADCGLDAVCRANSIGVKSNNGSLAPLLWQQGKQGEVINYCLNDVFLTLKVFERVIRVEPLLHPKSTQALFLRHPHQTQKPDKLALTDNFSAQVVNTPIVVNYTMNSETGNFTQDKST